MDKAEVVITMSGPELRSGPLPDELIAAVQRVLVGHGYKDHEHRWEGPTHRLVYHRE